MALSTKIILRKKPNKEGLFPLVIRITKDRKTSFVYTGRYIVENQWDEVNKKVRKSHPNSIRLNNYLIKKLSEVSDTVLDLQSKNKDFSSKEIKKIIVKPLGEETFNTISKRFLQGLEDDKKFSRLSSDKPRVNLLINFANSESLYFNEIDEGFLNRFISHLRTVRKNSERTIINNLIVIRTLFNIAIKEGVIEQKLYPFGKNKIKIKFPESEKIGLSQEEVKRVENLCNLTPQEEHSKNIWLFSFYFAGMRIADVLQIKWSDIYDSRLSYRMNKNSKLLSLKLPEKVIPIISKYKDNQTKKDDFIFPELKGVDLKQPKDVFVKTNAADKNINKDLKQIGEKADVDKKLTMHISRHTFGNLSGNKIPIQMLQKLYRHSSITTTINYQANFMHEDTDEALDRVVNF